MIIRQAFCLILIIALSPLISWASAPMCSQVFNDGRKLPAFMEYAINFNRAFLDYYQTETRVPQLRYAENAPEKTKRILQSIYNKPLQVILPLSTRRILPWDAPANTIFVKLWRNRNYEPSAQEWSTLAKYKAVDTFQKRQNFLKNHKNWHRFRKSLSMIHSGSLLAFFLLQNYFTAESFTNSVDAPTYLDENGDNIVELLNESVPFPHVALRINRHVFSYGVDRMTVSTLAEYIYSKQMNPATSRMGQLTALPTRTIQVIRLNLTSEEIHKLRQELESHVGKIYKNITLVNDCASMIIRALTKTTSLHIPSTIDMSPMAVFSYLTMMKMQGDPRIGILRQVTTEEKNLTVGTATRNLWINSMEAKFWMHVLPYNLPLRITMNLTLEDEELQKFDSEQQAYIEQYFHEVKQSVEDNIEIQGLRIQVAEKKATQEDIEIMIEMLKEPHTTTLKNPVESNVAILTAKYSIETLNLLKQEFLENIKKGEQL